MHWRGLSTVLCDVCPCMRTIVLPRSPSWLRACSGGRAHRRGGCRGMLKATHLGIGHRHHHLGACNTEQQRGGVSVHPHAGGRQCAIFWRSVLPRFCPLKRWAPCPSHAPVPLTILGDARCLILLAHLWQVSAGYQCERVAYACDVKAQAAAADWPWRLNHVCCSAATIMHPASQPPSGTVLRWEGGGGQLGIS